MDTQEKNIYFSVVIAAITLGAIVIYFIISLIRHQRRLHKLNRIKILTEIAMLEHERIRMSADLHDELGPLLSMIKLQVNSITITDEQDGKMIEKASVHLDEIIQKIREIAYNLMPNTLIRKGLVFAVKELVEKIGQIHKIEIRFNSPDDIAIDKDKQINIYRIIQECVHNALKHAHAQLLIIELTNDKGTVMLKFYDNGVGFNIKDINENNRGLGLQNLESRTEILGGEMHFQSEPGKGVQYIFEIPIA